MVASAAAPECVGVDSGGGVVVEVVQAGGGGQAGEPEPAGEPAGLGGVDLQAEETLQGGGHRQAFVAGLVEDGGQLFGGGVQAQRS